MLRGGDRQGGPADKPRPSGEEPPPRAEGQSTQVRDDPGAHSFSPLRRGSDRDGDKLSFLWEQNDPGGTEGTSLVDNRKKDGPSFRVFGTIARVISKGALERPSPHLNGATRNGTRYFPNLAQVLAGSANARTGAVPGG